jgi:hypothetical protein
MKKRYLENIINVRTSYRWEGISTKRGCCMFLIQDILFKCALLQSTLRLDSVSKTRKNELSHSCTSQTSSPVDDGNPAGMQVCTENNCLDKAGISDGDYNDAIKKKKNKNKT